MAVVVPSQAADDQLIARFEAYLGLRGRSPRTVDNYLATLIRLAAWLRDDGVFACTGLANRCQYCGRPVALVGSGWFTPDGPACPAAPTTTATGQPEASPGGAGGAHEPAGVRPAWLPPVGLLEAGKDHIRSWRAQLISVCDGTVLSYTAAARSFYRWAEEVEEIIEINPAAALALPRLRRRLPRPISEHDLQVALDTAPDRIRPWLVLAAYAGLRAGEIASLQRDQVLDTASPAVLIIRGKGDRERVVPLTSYVWGELNAHGLPRRGPVFTRRDGQFGPNRPTRVSQMANIHLRSCGFNETLHQLRHRFGTAAYHVSRDLRLVQELMGHSSPNTTAGYAAFDNASAVTVVNAIQPPDANR